MILAGQVIAGAWLSVTVTVNEQVLVLPEGSVAVAVTPVVPTGNVLPLEGLNDTLAEQLSVAVAT